VAVAWREPDVNDVGVAPFGVAYSFVFSAHDCRPAAHMRQSLNNVGILTVYGRILNAVRSGAITIPVRQLIEEYIRVLLKQPISERFCAKLAQPERHRANRDRDIEYAVFREKVFRKGDFGSAEKHLAAFHLALLFETEPDAAIFAVVSVRLCHDQYPKPCLVRAPAKISVPCEGNAGPAQSHLFYGHCTPRRPKSALRPHFVVGRAALLHSRVMVCIHRSGVIKGYPLSPLERHRLAVGIPTGNAAARPFIKPPPPIGRQHFMIAG